MPDIANTDPFPILRTKLHRPPLIADHVQRDRLLMQLERYPERSLTLISAPAGYGKSTLASSWLEKSGRPSAWVSLDDGDNDLRSFLVYICRAVRDIFPESMKELESALAVHTIPPAESMKRYLLNGVSAIEKPFIILLDDYQNIHDKTIHEMLYEMVRHPAPAMHLAVLTRHDPPLPIHKLRGGGMITEISMGDLLFNRDESREFLKKASDIDIDDYEAGVLEESLEGWITGLRLVSYSISDKLDLKRILAGFSEGNRTIGDYLVSEILSRQPEKISETLLLTSVLERFTAEAIDEICCADRAGGPDDVTGESFISWLRTNNIFLISLDDEDHWYRYHHLFRQQLLDRLEEERSQAEISDLRRWAARWHYKRGLLEAAIRYAIEGGDIDFAVEIIEKNRNSVIDGDNYYVLARWLDLIPEDMIKGRPALMISQAWVYFHTYDMTSLVVLLGDMEELAAGEGLSGRILGEYSFMRGWLQCYMGEGTESIESLTGALDLLEETDSHVRRASELHLVLSYHMVHGREKALALLQEFLGEEREINAIHRGRLLACRSFIGFLDIDLRLAARSARQGNAVATPESLGYVLSWTWYLEAIAHYMLDDPDISIELGRRALRFRYLLHARAASDAYALLILALMRRGKTTEAEETLLSFIEYAEDIDDPGCTSIAMSIRARLSMIKGNIGPAIRWMRTADLESEGGLMLWWVEVPRMTGCRILVAEGTSSGLERAVSMLETYREENRRINNRYQVLMTMPILARALLRLGRADDALEVLKTALEMAEPSRIKSPFLESGEEIASLLGMLVERKGESEFANELLDALGGEESSAAFPGEDRKQPGDPREDGMIHVLTERELTALRLLAGGLYYKEIAEEMAVSKDTVKTHIRHVYRKLGAGSRREAVSTAREAGILDPLP